MQQSYKKYGDFSKDGLEFIITNPNTPRPWINYLSNGEYCSLISQTGGGYSFYLDSGVNRLTRWAPANYMTDQPGRYLYLRDENTKEYWSCGHRPVEKSSAFECAHGLGYTIIKTEYANIKSEMTFFVPLKDSIDVCLIKITNKGKNKRKLKAFPFVEWLLGDWSAELGIRNITILLNRGYFDKDSEAIFVTKYPWAEKKWPYFGYIATTLKTNSFDVDYEDFMGKYRDYSNPIAVENGKCSNSTDVQGMNMVGALEADLELDAGEEKEFLVMVGITKSKNEAKKVMAKYRDLGNAKKEFENTKKFWHEAILGNTEVSTPDKEFDRAVNIWIKYQVYMNNHWGRSATFYHEGGGEFGYRNTTQDAWAMVFLNPEYAKEKLLKLMYHQRSSGQPLPGWSFATGASEHKPPSDFPIWPVLLLNAYLKETGDFGILKKKVDFYDGGNATVYEHIKKSIKFLMDMASSKRGLPLMGSQDWNDAFDRTGIGGKGESVWLGMGLCVALRNMEELANFLKDKKTAGDCRKRYEEMKKIINKVAWDGNWYIYAFNDYGEPLGSRSTKEGKIQLNAQTWAILAGLPDEDKLKKILKTIDKDLATPYGQVLFTPGYTEYNSRIGRITAFAIGTKENAAIFCHGGAFKVTADLKIGRAKEAYKTFKQFLSTASNKDIEVFKTEPYIYPEYLVGPGNPRYGEGAFSWLTGSADWFYVAATQGILGIRPEFEGLLIDPCIPSSWDSYKVIRVFRGDRYEITIENPHHVERGVAEIILDGKILSSNLIKPSNDKKSHRLKVVMGKPCSKSK